MLKHWYLQRFWTMIVAKNCYFWSVFPQISCGGYPQNSSKFPKPHFLLTCTYFGGRRHGRNLPMAKATDGLAFGVTRHCRIEGLPPMPPTADFCPIPGWHMQYPKLWSVRCSWFYQTSKTGKVILPTSKMPSWFDTVFFFVPRCWLQGSVDRFLIHGGGHLDS